MNYKKEKYIKKIKQAIKNNNIDDVKKYFYHLEYHLEHHSEHHFKYNMCGGENNKLIFRENNLTGLRDENLYLKLKKDSQRECLFFLYLYYIINIYTYFTKIMLNIVSRRDMYTWNDLINTEIYNDFNITNNESILLFTNELLEWKKYVEINNLEFNNEYLKNVKFNDIFNISINIINLYDQHFNNLIFFRKILNIEELTTDEYYKIIYYWIVKNSVGNGYFSAMFDPIFNTRSIIIGNYFLHTNGILEKRIFYPFKHSNGEIYNNYNDNLAMLILDNQFKIDIINNNYNDGYDFYWNNQNFLNNNNNDKQNIEICNRHLIEIYNNNDDNTNNFNENIMSMIVAKSPKIQNVQSHFYIKRNMITETKYLINNLHQFKNISLILHSFACWLFEAQLVLSTLHPSMRTIFEKNNIVVNDNINLKTEYPYINFCSVENLGLTNVIHINNEFRLLWLENEKYTYVIHRLNAYVMIYERILLH